MITIDLNLKAIKLIRGDKYTLEAEVVDDDGEEYDLSQISDLKTYFTIKDSFESENHVIQKERYDHANTSLANGIFHFQLVPLDTSNLDIKKYYADISIESSSDDTIKHTIGIFDLYITSDINTD